MDLCHGSVKVMPSSVRTSLQEERIRAGEKELKKQKRDHRLPPLPPPPKLTNMDALFQSYGYTDVNEDYPPVISSHSWSRAKPFKVPPT